MTPRLEAHAIRIWGIAKPADWDVTVPQLSAILELDPAIIRRAIKAKGWEGRLRSGDDENPNHHWRSEVRPIDEMIT